MSLPPGPGALLATRDGELVGATDEARGWLAAADRDVADVLARLGERAGHVLLDADGRPPLAAFASPVGGDRLAVVVHPAPAGLLLPVLASGHGLTARELDVLRLLVQGRPDREIAAELVIALDTAREHSSRVLAKLGVARRAELPARLFPHLLALG